MTNQELIHQLRQKARERYVQALQQIEILEQHLTGKLPQKSMRGGSIRKRVLTTVSDQWCNVDDIRAVHPELTPRQIRGVLTASDLKTKLMTRQTEVNGVEYKKL